MADKSHLSPDCPRSKTDGALSARAAEASGKSQSLPREVVVVWEHPSPGQASQLTVAEKNRCASMDEILTHSETKATENKTTLHSPASTPSSTAAPIARLQDLIAQKLEKTERLLMEVRAEAEAGKVRAGKESVEGAHVETERLLKEASAAWSQAHEVLEEVKELRALYRKLDSNGTKINKD